MKNLKNKYLYRTDECKMLGGVCSGLGEYMEIDHSLVRLVFVLLALFLGGSGLILYVVLWVILPMKENVQKDKRVKLKGD